MNKQISLSALSDELTQVRTKKKEFLAQIERIIPWSERLEMIKPAIIRESWQPDFLFRYGSKRACRSDTATLSF